MTLGTANVRPGVVHPAHEPVRDFIRLDIVSALVATVFLAVANAGFVREPGLYAIVAGLVVLVGVLLVANRELATGRVLASLALIAAGNWVLAVLVVSLLPWILPVLVLTIVMPLVLATPHLDGRGLAPFLAGAALTLAVAGLVGIGNDDGGVVDDLDDSYEILVIVGGMAAHAAPIGLIVWQANRRHRQTSAEANRLNELLSDSRRRLVEAGDAERTRIERDLHDGAQQRLIAVGMQLRMLSAGSGELSPVIAEIEGAMADIRELSHGISPPLLELQGLGPALVAAARRHGAGVTVEVGDIGRHARSVETAIYFCAIEALANAAKHAPDASVVVRLEQRIGGLHLTVTDDGPGFDPSAVTNSKGMVNMADRIGSLGGEFSVDARPHSGTTVTATVPDTDERVDR